MPPTNAYWGLFWSNGTSGTWAYASEGVDSLSVPAGGSVELRVAGQQLPAHPRGRPARPRRVRSRVAETRGGAGGGAGGGAPAAPSIGFRVAQRAMAPPPARPRRRPPTRPRPSASASPRERAHERDRGPEGTGRRTGGGTSRTRLQHRRRPDGAARRGGAGRRRPDLRPRSRTAGCRCGWWGWSRSACSGWARSWPSYDLRPRAPAARERAAGAGPAPGRLVGLGGRAGGRGVAVHQPAAAGHAGGGGRGGGDGASLRPPVGALVPALLPAGADDRGDPGRLPDRAGRGVGYAVLVRLRDPVAGLGEGVRLLGT